MERPPLKPYPTRALRQAAGLLILAALTGLIVNQLNPRGAVIAWTPIAHAGSAGWDNSETIDLPRPITLAQLQALLQPGGVTLIDARGHEEYLAGHLPGAINLPFESLYEQMERLKQLPRDQWTICYCDGGDCELSHHLAAELLRQGFRRVAIFPGGIAEWQLAYPLTNGMEESHE